MAPMGSATAVHLNGGKYSAFVRADGTFKVHGVPAGTAYVLQVVSSSMVFDQALRFTASHRLRVCCSCWASDPSRSVC